MNFRFLHLIFLIFIVESSFSQSSTDSVYKLDGNAPENKSVEASKHNPKLAAGLSAIIPGAGQVYNKKYWKVPVVYAGFAALIYGTSYYNENYYNFRSVYNDAMENTSDTTLYTVASVYGYTKTDLKTRRDFYRKYRDLCLIGVGVWYLLNIIDANVDAHFYDFDINEDLSIQFDLPSESHYPVEFAVRLRF